MSDYATLKTFSDMSRVIESERTRVVESEQRVEAERLKKEKTERKKARQDKAVVGGVYRPDPIDHAAAMLLARAPWWAFAPSVKREPKQEGKAMSRLIPVEKGEIDKKYHKKEYKPSVVDVTSAIVNRGGEEMYNMDKLADCFLRHMEEKYPPKVSNLARSIVDARTVLSEQMKGIGSDMDEFERVTKAAAQTVRTQRMSTVTECSHMVNAIKDVRQFFLGPDYEREQQRLADFVDLCERLKKLKDSGFLDTVADTMIRLASRE